jgi:hypothetical protein
LATVAWAGLALAAAAAESLAQAPPVHSMVPQGLPPGVVGHMRVAQGGPLAGYLQPVEIRLPQGASVALAEDRRFSAPQAGPVRVGMLIGPVYRLCLINLPQLTDVELFPTVELVDRVYPPPGQELRFPVPIEFTLEDLRAAASGKLVTRIIYVEDPKQAIPARGQGPGKDWFEVQPGSDPLAVADALGMPIAIVRIGGRTPDPGQGPDEAFLFGCPPLVRFTAQADAAPQQPAPPSAAPARPTSRSTRPARSPGVASRDPRVEVPAPGAFRTTEAARR